jgi:outer membrane receptor protein involved in Fe transport
MWPFGNTDLKPEKSDGGEIGFRWTPDKDTQAKASYFHTRYEDLLKVERVAVPLGQYKINNIPHAKVQGFESQWQKHWNDQLTTGIDFTIPINTIGITFEDCL